MKRNFSLKLNAFLIILIGFFVIGSFNITSAKEKEKESDVAVSPVSIPGISGEDAAQSDEHGKGKGKDKKDGEAIATSTSGTATSSTSTTPTPSIASAEKIIKKSPPRTGSIGDVMNMYFPADNYSDFGLSRNITIMLTIVSLGLIVFGSFVFFGYFNSLVVAASKWIYGLSGGLSSKLKE